MFNKQNKTKSIIPIISILLTLIVSVTFSYSWIIGDLTPTIKGTFKVSTQAGITMAVGGDEGSTVIDMNATSSEGNIIELAEVSSPDGTDFYRRNMDKYYEDDNGVEINTYTKRTSTNQLASDYAEVSMTLSLSFTNETSDYYLYFIDGSLTSGDEYNTAFKFTDGRTGGNLRALRCALFFQKTDDYVAEDYPLFERDNGSEIYTFFGNTQETETSNETAYITSLKSQKIGSNTENVINTTNNTTVLRSFHEASIDPYGNGEGVGTNGTEIPNDSYILKFNKSQTEIDMRVVVWLEGGSNYCNQTYLGTDRVFNLELYFVIFELLNEDTETE